MSASDSNKTFHDGRLERARIHFSSFRLLGPAVIVVTIALVFGKSLRGALLRPDDVLLLAYVQDHGPFSAFLDHSQLWFGDYYYRPIFVMQTWLFHELFDLNHAGYRAALLLLHTATSLIIFAAVGRLTGSRLAALVAALLYAVEPRTTVLVSGYVSDSGPITSLLAALTLLLVVRPSDSALRHVALFSILVLAPMTRENGLVLVAAIGAYAVGGLLFDYSNRSLSAKWLAIATAATGVYFAFRLYGFGLLPQELAPHTAGLFGQSLGYAETEAMGAVKRLGLSLYTVVANLVAVFSPFFGHRGVLDVRHMLLALASLSGLALPLWPRFRTHHPVTYLSATAVLSLALVLVAAAGSSRPTSIILHSVLSAATCLMLVRLWPRLPNQYKGTIVFAVALIVGNALVAFAYFRWRNLTLGYLGWILLLSIFLTRGVPVLPSRAVRALVTLFVLLLLFSYGGDVYMNLPQRHLDPDHFANAQVLCRADVPEDLALRIAHASKISPARVMHCRIVKP